MVTYGLIGVGAIASAIVRGLCEDVAQPPDVLLSPRNAGLAADLASRFPTVAVRPDNQAVLDDADLVVLCLRPQDVASLAGLTVRPELVVVSAMAGVSADALAARIGPVREIARAIPLPSVARREGTTAVYPPVPAAVTLFDRIGRALPVSDVAAFDALSAATATIAAHCAALATISRWLVGRGVEVDAASDYVASLYAGLAPALRPGCDLDELAKAHATPGGINELFRAHLSQAAVPQAIERGLDRVLERVAPR